MRLRSLLSAAVLLVPCLAAHADTTTVFDLNSTFSGADGTGTLIGTLTVDTTLGTLLAADLTASGFLFGNGAVTLTSSNDLQVQLLLPGNNLVGYTGSPICSISFLPASCADGVSLVTAVNENLTSDAVLGTLEPATVTPEPSAFALLGTGLLGTAGLLRKKVSG